MGEQLGRWLATKPSTGAQHMAGRVGRIQAFCRSPPLWVTKTSSLGADCHWLATTQPSNPFMPARGSRARRLSHDSNEPKMSPGSDVAVGALTGSPRLCWNGGAHSGVLADLLIVTRHWGGAGRPGLCWQGQCWSNTMLHTATAPVWVQPGELGHTGKQDKNRPSD